MKTVTALSQPQTVSQTLGAPVLRVEAISPKAVQGLVGVLHWMTEHAMSGEPHHCDRVISALNQLLGMSAEELGQHQAARCQALMVRWCELAQVYAMVEAERPPACH